MDQVHPRLGLDVLEVTLAILNAHWLARVDIEANDLEPCTGKRDGERQSHVSKTNDPNRSLSICNPGKKILEHVL
jgi:hypothetical protein